MNLRKLSQNFRILLLTAALCPATSPAGAIPVEQIGDRYIIHVPELDLRGDESLIDILMMCPDVITLDGKTQLSSDPLAELFGKYVFRFDNVGYALDDNTLAHNLKAREIEKIQICMNSEVMKGAGSMKKVIDIHLRDVERTSGRVGLFGDTYGGAEAIASVRSRAGRVSVLSHVEGSMQRSAFNPATEQASATSHRSHEGAKVCVNWDITDKDLLIINATQTYTRRRIGYLPGAYERNYSAELDYTRTLSERGAYALLTLGATQTTDSRGELQSYAYSADYTSTAYRDHYTYPVGILEFYFPLLVKNLWITAGFEGGISIEENCLAQYTNRSNYEDLYAQADWSAGRWSLMLGDRYRTIHFRHNELKDSGPYSHSTRSHAYTASAIYHITPAHTLQATFSRRFFDPGFGDFLTADIDDVAGQQRYTPDHQQRFAHVAELRHHISSGHFMLSSVVQNIQQDIGEGSKDKTLCVGSTAFWHTGMLRLTAGANYYWERVKNKFDYLSTQHHYAVLKLAPQLSLPAEWRLTSTLLWSTRRAHESCAYAPANLYAEASAYKTFGRHWLAELRYHDIAGQRWGNRAATLGCTYYF